MAGHSKWANIQHRKGNQDAKRSKLFTKFIHEISFAAKEGGNNPDNNSRLRAVIDKALNGNMSRNVIDRAARRGVRAPDDINYEDIRYEGYGPDGIAIMMDCLTDNRNRTVAAVRNIFTKYGGNMGTDGSVSYLFSKKGIISYGAGTDEDTVMEVSLEAGAYDVITNDDNSIDVLTAPKDYLSVKDSLEAIGLTMISADVIMYPKITVTLNARNEKKVLAMIDAFEGMDDVQYVYTNANFSDEER
ncbi:MAG: YebC/PmpR family DNA-binding transcriptional regulator [Piscirickettsiaceae bacterium]|nr:YebC/PmpR family DNA-binding transcriptional regulator [Piscirickettsiaceae bacterium]